MKILITEENLLKLQTAIRSFSTMKNFLFLLRILGVVSFAELYRHASKAVAASSVTIPHGFSKIDLILVYLYTHQTLATYHYKSLNSVLRGHPHPNERELRRLADLITISLLKLPPYSGGCVRFADLTVQQIAGYSPGSIVEEVAFTSSSADLSFRRFVGVSYTMTSKSGRKIAFMSKFPNEDEVLFPPGAKFLVLQNATIGGITQIVMEEVQCLLNLVLNSKHS